MSEQDPVRLEIGDEGRATITLARPERHNAFGDLVIGRLLELFEAVRADRGCRVLLLRAEGRSFSAGADLEWMRRAADMDEAQNQADAIHMGEMFYSLRTLPQPTIALVQGPAYGGGVGLVAAADIAIGVRGAAFSFTEVKLGLIPAVISPYVIEAIGARAAGRYFLTAERVSAEEAQRIGLLHEVVEDAAALDRRAAEIVDLLRANAPGAMAAAKDLVRVVAGRPVDRALITETAARIARQRATEEGREGTRAFLEKRKPGWAS